MPSAIERAIDDLSDASVALPDALRRLLVVARRIGADDLAAWLTGELNGYDADAVLPAYRMAAQLLIKLRFDGMLGSSANMRVMGSELPDEISAFLDDMGFREPAAELEALSGGDRDLELPLPTSWVGRYRQLASDGRVPRWQGYVLNDAAVVIPGSHLKGLLDRIRSTALDLALSLEHVAADAGDNGGPTVSTQPQLGQAITVHLTQLFANGANITIGDHANVASGVGATLVQLVAGDLSALIAAASHLLSVQGVGELSAALDSDGGQPGDATRSFLSRVRSGAVVLASGVATNAAYDGLLALIHQVFPGVLT